MPKTANLPLTAIVKPSAEMPEVAKDAHRLFLRLAAAIRNEKLVPVSIAVWSLIQKVSVDNASSLNEAKATLEYLCEQAKFGLETAWKTTAAKPTEKP